jgi:hypothetical protein
MLRQQRRAGSAGGAMPRRRIFEKRLHLPISDALLARVDSVLRPEEVRAALIREAVEKEVTRRERKAIEATLSQEKQIRDQRVRQLQRRERKPPKPRIKP